MSEINETKDGLTVYEISYLILSSIPEDKISGVVDNIKNVISKAQGKELDSEDPFKQDLAYKMSKTVGSSRYVSEDAYLGWIKFEAMSDVVPSIKADVEKMDEILRVLLIKAPRETKFTFAKAKAEIEREEKEKKDEEKAKKEAENTSVEEEEKVQ